MDALKTAFSVAKVAAQKVKNRVILERIEAAKDERKASLTAPASEEI